MRILSIFGLALLTLSCTTLAQETTDTPPEWDVTTVEAPHETVRFTVDEGTWMNLDVSPDGQEIVFDLLGDIYTMPVTGGEARLLRGGPAFEIQPRYSPDGARISFTSDRSGGDNIWTMARDGSDLRQITDESFRLLNNAVWTPDGEYLIARKHFTSTRSLGAGEMWMYHSAGGTSGLKLTTRKNDQQDAGEPDVSPDGRYLFFSEDVSPGPTFQYNKDPYGQIYAVRRFDLETCDLRTLIGGAGGAARPQVSPDGRYVAFVRRVREESVLYLYDRETGAQTPLFDGLSRDQQETWAVFGVYPNFDWMPDSQALVFWAQGKLWTIDVASKDLAEIPFTVEAEHRLVEPVRFTQDLTPGTFRAKMLRDAATSPDGGTLVFHAAGHLYRMVLPDGAPERLLSDPDYFAYDPAFSPDGRWLVYTTWNDDAYGAIYRVPVAGGAPEQLTERPGYYFTPRFSPDGAQIVYRRGSGHSLLGTLHSVDTGIFVMNADGSDVRKVREGGDEPRFDASGERIYFMTGGGLDKEYRSIEPDGSDERTHFDLKYVDHIVPSPDGEWVALTELFNVYIAPFPKTGGSVELSKDTKAVPVKQVTRDAGTDLHWSADSERLHWLIGPEYFTRDLSDSFTFVEGAPQELPPVDTVGTAVELVLETDLPEGVLAFTGARLITMNGDEVIENGTLVVEGNRIAAVGAADEVEVPAGATVVDASGQTITPGWVDAHAHANHFFSGPTPQRNWTYYANLAYGVTTMHDPSANTETVFTLGEMVKAGEIVGPRVFSTGTILYGADGDFKAVINSLEDARSHLRRMKAVGAISVKSYNQPRRDQRQQVLRAAREYELMVVPEGGSTFFHNITMILDGHTGIEHNIPVAPLYDDVMTLWGNTLVGYTPTLVVNYGGLNGEYYWYARSNVWENERLLAYTPRGIIDARSRRREIAAESDYWHVTVAEQAKKLVDRGGLVQMGAHGQLQGLAAHWETWMFVQGGMTPHEALRSATLHGARYLGLDAHLGSLEPGKLADLVVLDANPLDDIRNTEQIRSVMVNGRLYDASTMNEIGNHPRERGPFYWERDEVDDTFIWQDVVRGDGH